MTYWVVRCYVLVELYGNRYKLLVTSDKEQSQWHTQLHSTVFQLSQRCSVNVYTQTIMNVKRDKVKSQNIITRKTTTI